MILGAGASNVHGAMRFDQVLLLLSVPNKSSPGVPIESAVDLENVRHQRRPSSRSISATSMGWVRR